MTDRPRGGVAAATSFYGNRAAGAASAGLKQRKKEKLGSSTTSGGADRWAPLRASKSAGDLEVGFKSPRAVAQWKQRKLEMAGMVTEVKRWDENVKPWEKKVATPAPVQRRDFSRISLHAVQSFEQWHDRHTHLDYPAQSVLSVGCTGLLLLYTPVSELACPRPALIPRPSQAEALGFLLDRARSQKQVV